MTISSLNIIVPLKNEEKGIDNLIQNLTPILQKIQKKTKISLIDDHSTDQTLKILCSFMDFFDVTRNFFRDHLNFLYDECKNGTMMIDEITYSIPFGIIGRLMHFIWVKRELKKIFNYRYKVINEIFEENK